MDKGIIKLLFKSLHKHRVIYGNNGNKSVNAKITKVTIQKQLSNKSGPDPGRCNRCKCIGQKKIADAFIGQIFTANNEKQHYLRKHKAYNAQISTKLVFLEMRTKHIHKFTSERFVLPKACPALLR